MKTRDYKNIGQHEIVHVYNRGNNKEKIFFDSSDYKAFLYRLGLALGIEAEELNKIAILSVPNSRIRINPNKDCFKLHCFCLMPNHFHLLIEQCKDVHISKLISQICTSYSMYINKKYRRTGHVFQDQFKSVLVNSSEQLMWVSSYIHMNPVKDGIVPIPQDYLWSSYNDYLGRELRIVYTESLLSFFEDRENFKKQTFILASENSSVKDAP